MTPLDPFYLIVGDAAWVDRLVPLGLKLVQLRLKDQPAETVRQHVSRALATCKGHDCTLVVNDYWEIAIELGCQYVHLGQEDLVDADIQAIKRAGVRFGLSTHDHDELDTALSHEPDYIALGPIYPTQLKQLSCHPQGVEKISEWKNLVGNLPLVAIGGLTSDRVSGVLAAGADSAAVSTDITGHPDPESQVKKWLALTR